MLLQQFPGWGRGWVYIWEHKVRLALVLAAKIRQAGIWLKTELAGTLFKQKLQIVNRFVNKMLLQTWGEKIFALSF